MSINIRDEKKYLYKKYLSKYIRNNLQSIFQITKRLIERLLFIRRSDI